MELYDYWRSSAAYRVRIALNLKGIAYASVPVNLRCGGQRSPDFRRVNPLGTVPCLRDGDVVLSQSLAIVEYLDETHPEPPLLPGNAAERARARQLALLIACEMHPLNNLKVLQYLEHGMGLAEEQRRRWYRHWITEGFTALEAMLAPTAGDFALGGDRPSVVDAFLVPQVYNANRWRCDMSPYPTICRINDRCLQLEAFAAAAPERQPDAPPPRPAG
jgi:maleylacetoacetate isomerase